MERSFLSVPNAKGTTDILLNQFKNQDITVLEFCLFVSEALCSEHPRNREEHVALLKDLKKDDLLDIGSYLRLYQSLPPMDSTPDQPGDPRGIATTATQPFCYSGGSCAVVQPSTQLGYTSLLVSR